jgi:hypothetical protein
MRVRVLVLSLERLSGCGIEVQGHIDSCQTRSVTLMMFVVEMGTHLVEAMALSCGFASLMMVSLLACRLVLGL